MENEVIKKVGASILIAIGIATGGIGYVNNGNTHSGYEIKNYTPVEAKKDYTVLIYMNGSNLESIEGAGTEDINEIIKSYPKESNINIVGEAGGASDWYTEELTGKGNTRFLIGDSGIKNAEKIEEKNMGVSDTLADFINYGIQSYPAEKYILIFWDHGGGSINGFGDDELYGDDSLQLSEIDEAFEKSIAKNTPIELIGFDACLMSTVETANILKDRGKYMISSQELEPEDGWNYEWLSKLNDKTLTGDKIGEIIIDNYFNYYNKVDYDLTMSVIDLKNVGGLYKYIDEFVDSSNINNEAFINEISKNRDKIIGFGNGLGKSSTAEMTDMKSVFSSICKMKSINLSEFTERMDKAIVFNRSKGYSEEPCGLSIYLPVNTEVDLVKNFIIYNKDEFSGNYVDFIENYDKYLLKKDTDSTNVQGLIPEFQEEFVKLVLPREEIKDISTVYLTVYQEFKDNSNIYYCLGTDSDVDINLDGTVTAKIDKKFTYIENVLVCTIEKEFTKEYLKVLSPALLNNKLVYLIIKYDYLNCNGSVIGFMENDDKSITPNKVMEIGSGDEIIPLYPKEEGIHDLSNIPSSKIYDNKYFEGELITVDKDGLDVNQDVLKQEGSIKYGFVIVNSKQDAVETIAVDKKTS